MSRKSAPNVRTVIAAAAAVAVASGAAAPDQLLEPSTQSRPERNVELRRKSEARADDPFDLPPE